MGAVRATTNSDRIAASGVAFGPWLDRADGHGPCRPPRLLDARHPRRDDAADGRPAARFGAHLPGGDVLGRRLRRAGATSSPTGGRAMPTPASTTPPARRSPTPSRSSRAPRPRYVFASGMAAIHAALLSVVCGRRPDRLHAERLRHDALAAHVRARPARRADGVRRRDRPRGRRGRARRGADPRPLPRDDLQPDDLRRSTSRRSTTRPPPRRPARSSTTRSPRPTSAGRIELGADLVVESATKYLSRPQRRAGGRRRRLARARSPRSAGSRPTPGATLAPFSAFLVLRGLPTLAIRMRPPRARRPPRSPPGSRRQPGVDARLLPGPRVATRSARSPRASSRWAAACSRSSWPAARGRRRAPRPRSSTR